MNATSTRNPFRDRLAQSPTGSSTGSQGSEPPPIPRRPTYAPPTEPPAPQQQQEVHSPTVAAQTSSSVAVPPSDDLDVDGGEDFPPPYTASANSNSGESTLSYGPARPFQPVPQPTFSSQIPPNQPQWQQHVPTPHHPGNHPPPHHGGPELPPPQLPPRHPSTVSPSHSRPVGSGPPPIPNVSTMPGSFPPLPGSPPSMGRQNSTTDGIPPASPSSGPGGIPNDGKPTPMPVPGHPLLNHGRVLIYPPDYTCYKCHNIGYKNFDPTHPCRTCWERYSRPYAGPLQYATWSPGSPNFQRPLPSFHPPSQTSPPPVAPRPYSVYSPPTQVPFTAGAPPGALVVQPGDPRIGGRLCWNCNGRGVVLFLLFVEETCPTCNGTGRVFP